MREDGGRGRRPGVPVADPSLTPLVSVFLGLLHDVGADITAGWAAGADAQD
ncbi:hypothetical protein [Nonomuraea sp. NPDC003754]